MASARKAILAGGCFWGMQDLIRRQPGVISTRVGYSGGDTPTRPTATTARTPRPSRSSTTPPLPITGRCWSSSSKSTIRQRRTGRATTGDQLPVRHLLPRRRAKANRAGHHRRRRGVRAMARKCGDRGQPGRRLLGGRARASGLPAALPQRVHLPLRPPRLEAAPTGNDDTDPELTAGFASGFGR